MVYRMKDIFEIFYIEIFALIIILGLTEIVCVAISRKQGKMLAQGKYNPKEELKKSGEYQKVQIYLENRINFCE